MLYVFTGDSVFAKARALKLAEGSELVRFGEGGESFAHVLGYLEVQGLFVPKTALLLDRPLDDEDGKNLLLEHSAELLAGGALVLVIEPVLSAPIRKALPKGVSIENFELATHAEDPAPNAFALTDSFVAGDRKNSWITYRRLIEAGSSPEEIHGILMWQARALVVASKSSTAEGTGLKPFVYSKAKKASVRIGEAGCVDISRELVALVHRARLGGGNLGDLLEAFLLKK